jgi:hypothetical protein
MTRVNSTVFTMDWVVDGQMADVWVRVGGWGGGGGGDGIWLMRQRRWETEEQQAPGGRATTYKNSNSGKGILVRIGICCIFRKFLIR